MPAAKITDFLKAEEKSNQVAVQGYVPLDLRQAVLEQMAKDKKAGFKVTWDTFLEAACRAYLSERQTRR